MNKKPQIILRTFLGLVLCAYAFFMVSYPVYSDEVDDLEDQIEETAEELDEKEGLLSDIESKIASISSSNYSVSQKISLINAEIAKLQEIIDKKDGEIEEALAEIEMKQEDLASKKVLLDDISSDLYIESRYGVSHFFLTNSYWDNFVDNFVVKKNIISFLKGEIESINGEFTNLADSKAELEGEKEALDEEKEELDDSYALLADEKAKLQAELNSKYVTKNSLDSDIEDLNDKVSQLQQALINARSAGYVSTGGSTGTILGTAISQAPSGYFGVFSIGAYTHRNGMSQWGARARADAGQTYQQILSAYYPSYALTSNYSEPSTVHVLGSGVDCNNNSKYYDEHISFNTYLKRIYEVPSTWPSSVLKAQAIAARSYAIYKINTQGYIVPNQSNQVSKDCLNGSGWINAVDSTEGVVLTKSSVAAITQFAAVHGAWVNNVGWDTVNGSGADWFVDAWEKESGVNWFYKSWYKQGYSESGTTCGHSPWMSPDEMVGVLNSYLIKQGSGLKSTPDLSRLLPQDFGTCPGRLDYGRTDKVPYTFSQLKSFLISPVQSIYSVSRSFSSGITSNITFSTNRGSVSMTGLQFKGIYNQVAPGHMRIQQQSFYAFFNIEKK